MLLCVTPHANTNNKAAVSGLFLCICSGGLLPPSGQQLLRLGDIILTSIIYFCWSYNDLGWFVSQCQVEYNLSQAVHGLIFIITIEVPGDWSAADS